MCQQCSSIKRGPTGSWFRIKPHASPGCINTSSICIWDIMSSCSKNFRWKSAANIWDHNAIATIWVWGLSSHNSVLSAGGDGSRHKLYANGIPAGLPLTQRGASQITPCESTTNTLWPLLPMKCKYNYEQNILNKLLTIISSYSSEPTLKLCSLLHFRQVVFWCSRRGKNTKQSGHPDLDGVGTTRVDIWV